MSLQSPAPSVPLAVSFSGLTTEDFKAAVAQGVQAALADGIRAEVRAFLEEYFGCMDKAELAAFLGVSERTIEYMWADKSLPKDTALGDRNPRAWLPAVKEILGKSRIKAREERAPKLRVVKASAA